MQSAVFASISNAIEVLPLPRRATVLETGGSVMHFEAIGAAFELAAKAAWAVKPIGRKDRAGS